MPKGSRYVKPASRTYAPTLLVVMVPEYSLNLEAIEHGACQYRARRVAVMVSRRRGLKWSGKSEPELLHPDDAWERVSGLVTGNTRVYVVAPALGDMLTTTGFWARVDRGEYRIADYETLPPCSEHPNGQRVVKWQGRLVLGGPPDIVQVRHKKGSVVCVSLRNYSESGWQDLRSACMGDKDGCRDRRHVETDGVDDVCEQCIIATRYMQSLICRWVKDECGPWKETVAGLSVSLWRSRFYSVKVCRHDDDDAIRLEKESAYGGRNEVWFYGDVGSAANLSSVQQTAPSASVYPAASAPVYRCDVASQYPALLAQELFPVRLLRTHAGMTPDELASILKYYGAIAHVTIRTAEPEYPCRRSNETVYCSGTFVTRLAGPELQYASESGAIKRVHSCAVYQLGQPLREYAQYLLKERADAVRDDEHDRELFAKCLSTAIGGKFSQRATRRELRPGIVSPFSRWGVYYQITSSGQQKRYIVIAGNAFEDVESSGAGKLLSAVYCYLTSYGRIQMARVRRAIHPCIPYSQCTDGIWVGEAGIAALKRNGLSTDRIPGKLRAVSVHQYARWFTPNHYYVDGRWVLSGYRYGSRVAEDMSVIEYRDNNPIRTVAYAPPMAIRREYIKRSIMGVKNPATIGDDGWLIPAKIRERL